MRRVRALLSLLGLAALLAGCTGTTPNIPPLLLALGRSNPSSGNPEMVLVEDNFPNAPRTLTVVPNSAQTLTYPAVASDVVDRAGARSAMVVLTRDLAGGTSPASRLLTFNLANIDPAAPTAFQQTSTPIQLTGAPATNPVFSGSNGPWCFNGVTVSLTGRYVTLLDDPLACGDSSRYPRLYQLDTSTTPPTVKPVVLASGVQTTLATVPFDDQASTNETLYFLVSGTTYAQVFADPVPHTSATAPTNPIASLPSLQQTVLLGINDQLGDLSQLVAITNQDPYAVNSNTSDIQALNVSTNAYTDKQTVDGARALAVDPAGITSQAVVAGSSQLAVHSSPGVSPPAETLATYGLTGVAAAIDPLNQFAYVVDDNQITVLDLLQVTTCSTTACWYAAFHPVLSLPTNPATSQVVTTLALARSAP